MGTERNEMIVGGFIFTVIAFLLSIGAYKESQETIRENARYGVLCGMIITVTSMTFEFLSRLI